MKKLLSLLLIYILLSSTSFAKNIKFAQITDVQLGKGNSEAYLNKAIQDINSMKDIDFVIFTGDNTASAREELLNKFVSEAKKLNKPFYIVVGDRDVSKSKKLPKEVYAKKLHKLLGRKSPKTLNYTFNKGNILFIAVDGAKDFITMPNGFFPKNTLDWLETQIKTHPNKKIVILQHFPLVNQTNNELLYTANAIEYVKIIDKYPNVISVISGHFNKNDEILKNGIYYIVTPSVNMNCYKIIEIDQDNGYQIYTSLVEMD